MLLSLAEAKFPTPVCHLNARTCLWSSVGEADSQKHKPSGWFAENSESDFSHGQHGQAIESCLDKPEASLSKWVFEKYSAVKTATTLPQSADADSISSRFSVTSVGRFFPDRRDFSCQGDKETGL